MARMTYETITDITDELLAMRWRSEPSCRMWFGRRNAAPGRLGLQIVADGDEFRVEPKARKSAAKSAETPPRPNSGDFEPWAFEVDQLLQDANEPAETDDTLEMLFNEGMTPGLAAQRIINRRAADLEVAAPSAKSTALPPPAVVGDTMADQAAAVHADSKPQLPVPAPKFVEVKLFASQDMAPIVARRLSDITGASVEFRGADGMQRIEPREPEPSAPRR